MYIRANINGWHTVLQLKEDSTVAEVVAYNLEEKKADFMVKALNSYSQEMEDYLESNRDALKTTHELAKVEFGPIGNDVKD